MPTKEGAQTPKEGPLHKKLEVFTFNGTGLFKRPLLLMYWCVNTWCIFAIDVFLIVFNCLNSYFAEIKYEYVDPYKHEWKFNFKTILFLVAN